MHTTLSCLPFSERRIYKMRKQTKRFRKEKKRMMPKPVSNVETMTRNKNGQSESYPLRRNSNVDDDDITLVTTARGDLLASHTHIFSTTAVFDSITLDFCSCLSHRVAHVHENQLRCRWWPGDKSQCICCFC